MSVLDVTRAYDPYADFKFNGFQQNSIATLQALANTSSLGQFPHYISPVQLVPSLIHRKCWALFYSVSGTFTLDVDLVFRLKGVERLRQKIIHTTTAVDNYKFIFCFSSVTGNYGAVNEQMIYTIANTTSYGICPHRLNIAADEAFFDLVNIAGAAANFDSFLAVQSQAGI